MDHLYAKKSLGQNFLKSKGAVRTIIQTASLSENDIALEIGPGKGILTEGLIEHSAKTLVVEKDDRMIPFLTEKFAQALQNKKLEIVHGDILEIDPPNLGLKQGEYTLVANIPYYITGLIIRRFLSETIQPKRMVLMVQKEVAQRIVASDKKESLLSISVKVYGNPKYIEKVPAKYFAPAPKVDSAILLIENISKIFFKEIDEETFFAMLRKGFAHKRKVLCQNLEVAQEKREAFFVATKTHKNTRPEEVSVEQWGSIYHFLTQKA